MKILYKSPTIQVEELEKFDVLCASDNVEKNVNSVDIIVKDEIPPGIVPDDF